MVLQRVFGHPVLPSPDVASYREWVSRHPDGHQVRPSEYPLSRVVRGEAERAELEVLYMRGDEREAWVRLVAAPIRDEAGRTVGGVVACLDIDREKRAEAGLLRANEELGRRVAERTAERDRMWRLSTDLMLVARFDATIVAVNPAWTAPNSPWAGAYANETVAGGSAENPLKARWMGIVNGVGIHGTGAPGSIGSRASHGCIRMTVPDVVDLYPRVPVGTPVLIGN